MTQGRVAVAAAFPRLGVVLGWGWGWDAAPGWGTSSVRGCCLHLLLTLKKDTASVLNLKPRGHGTERSVHPSLPPRLCIWGEKNLLERSREPEQSDLPEMRRVIRFLCRFVNCFKQEITSCLEKPPSTCNAGKRWGAGARAGLGSGSRS